MSAYEIPIHDNRIYDLRIKVCHDYSITFFIPCMNFKPTNHLVKLLLPIQELSKFSMS